MENILNNFVDQIKKEDLHTLYVQIRKNGTVTDYWSRFSKMTRTESYSTSKTFCSIGFGIALDEGIISLDEKVAGCFPEYTYDISNPYALDITVKDMLTMSSGLKYRLFARDDRLRSTCRDWVDYFYHIGEFVKKPGETFLYDNFNTYMLGCMLEKKTGVNLYEFLRYRVFEALGIGNPDMTSCPKGHTVAANGMAINVDELSRLGQMIMDGGVYNGKRIVSEKYIKEMTSAQITSDKPIPGEADGSMLDYGYQLWIDSKHGTYHMWGIFGQYVVMIPQKDTVISVVSLEENDDAVGKHVWEDLVIPLL